MRHQVTLRDVALGAGVHVSTVSRVLRDDSGRIGEETAARIITVAKELGFQHNRWAASLRSGRTQIIGVLVPRISDVVLATVFEAIEGHAAKSGYQAVVSSTWDDPASREAQIRRYLGERVDGLIVGDARVDEPKLIKLAQDGVPIVLVSRKSRGLPSVTGNDKLGGAMAAEHLIEQGCRTLAVVAGPEYAQTAIDRVAGFVTAARSQGFRVQPWARVNSRFDVEGGQQAMVKILENGTPDGVFAVNDFAAIGAMSVLRARGLVPGQDVSVVGYNAIDLSAHLMVPLTSVYVPLEEMGHRTVDAMLELLATGKTRSVSLKPVLIARESTGAVSDIGQANLSVGQ